MKSKLVNTWRSYKSISFIRAHNQINKLKEQHEADDAIIKCIKQSLNSITVEKDLLSEKVRSLAGKANGGRYWRI